MTKGVPLLEAIAARRRYGRRPEVRAVDGVDLTVHQGCSVGIAGESGSGKSTLLRLLLGLENPNGGVIRFRGDDVRTLRGVARRSYRASVQAVFQDPGSSLNPRQRVWKVATEPAWVVDRLGRGDRRELVRELLASVELPVGYADRYPHQLSGGERQRVAIARALSCRPAAVLLDEPVTSLDVSIRGHVINLLNERAREAALTYVVVSHDLTAIYHLTEYLYVMRHGVVVEHGPTADVIAGPRHPYTARLVAALDDPLLHTLA